MSNIVVLPAAAVESLRRKAKQLKKSNGIPHHEALDAVAREGDVFIDWYQLIQAAKATEPSEKSFKSGFLVGLDPKDVDGVDPSVFKSFVLDEQLLMFVLSEMRKEKLHEKYPGLEEEYAQLVYYRYTGRMLANFDAALDVSVKVFFSPPRYLRFKGQVIEATSRDDGDPIDFIEKVENQQLSSDIHQTILGEGAEVITDALVKELVQRGWTRELVEQYRAQGMTYSRPRNSFLGPVMTDEDFLDDDDTEDEDPRNVSGKDAFIKATGGFKIGLSMAELESNERKKYELLGKMAKGTATPADIARLDDLRGVDDED